MPDLSPADSDCKCTTAMKNNGKININDGNRNEEKHPKSFARHCVNYKLKKRIVLVIVSAPYAKDPNGTYNSSLGLWNRNITSTNCFKVKGNGI